MSAIQTLHSYGYLIFVVFTDILLQIKLLFVEKNAPPSLQRKKLFEWDFLVPK